MNAMEVDDDQNLNNEPFVIHFQPGKLTDFAAVSFAAALLRNKIEHMRRNCGRGFKTHALDLAQISIPNVIREIIHKLVNNMERKWTEWWFHHSEKVFLLPVPPPPDNMIDWLGELVWSDDGTINYERTAENLLNYDKITYMQKYQVACAYCFIDHVENLKQTLTQKFISEEIDKLWRPDKGLIPYWSHRSHENRSEEKQLEQVCCQVMNRFSKNSFEVYDEWSAIEYFFDKLDNKDRPLNAFSILFLAKPRLTLFLLPKLTCSELDRLIKEDRFLNIMRTLLKKRNYFEYAKQLWKRMVHIIDDDSIGRNIRQVNGLNDERSSINSLLWEFWSQLSERQKKYIINQQSCDFTEAELDINYNSYFTPNYPLILDFLSHCDFQRKHEYWSKNFAYFVVGQLASENRSIIDHIMKLCIVDDQKIEEFKKTVMLNIEDIRYYCAWLILVGRIKEIQTYLEFCTSDSQLIRDMKKKILMGISKGCVFEFLFQRSNEETTRDFNLYLNDIFGENESKEFLNAMIMHPRNLKKMLNALKTSEKLEDVMKMVEKYASSEENIIKIKHDLFELCRLDAGIEKLVIFDLTAWCFDANKSVVEKLKEVSLLTSSNEWNAGTAGEVSNSTDEIYKIFTTHY